MSKRGYTFSEINRKNRLKRNDPRIYEIRDTDYTRAKLGYAVMRHDQSNNVYWRILTQNKSTLQPRTRKDKRLVLTEETETTYGSLDELVSELWFRRMRSIRHAKPQSQQELISKMKITPLHPLHGTNRAN